MIQTAPLSPVITVSRGPASPQAGAQVSVTAVDFAGSFAKASDDATPIAPPAPAFAPSPAVIALADPAAPIGDGLPEASAPATTRQEWAATGNGLPIPVRADGVTVAAAAAWQPMRTSPLAMELVATSSPAPVDPTAAAASAASMAASSVARPGARPATGRPAPATLSRPSAAVGRDDAPDDTSEEGEAGDGSASMTAGAAIAAPSPAISAPDIADAPPPLAALPTKARLGRSEADTPAAAVSTKTETLSQAVPRSRSARRAKLAGPPATAPLPVSTQRGTIPAGSVPSPAANGLVSQGSPRPQRMLDTRTPAATISASEPLTSSRARPADARILPGGDPGDMASPALPSASPSPSPSPSASTSASPGRSAFADATAPAPVAGLPNRSGPDGSDPRLASTARKGSIQSAMPPSGMPMAATDGLTPLSVRSPAAQPAPLATVVPASTEPPLTIAGKPPRGRASPPPISQADALVRVPQDLPLVPVSVSAPAPAMPALAAAVMPTPGITASLAGMPASNPVAATADTPRWTARQATASVAETPQPPLPSTASSILSTMSQGAATLASPSLPTIAANAPVPPAATPAVLAVDTPSVASIPRWTATEATAPVALAVARPELVQPQPGTVASAGRIFGAAIQAAQTARSTRDADKTGSIDAASLSATVAPSQPVAPTAATQQAPLDMRQERWPHAMIARIEMIRDAADATDTRIRLIPDALGAIDVSVKTEGATVHVHFAAEQAATRTLLADAQPRLAELAEARGLKLGQGAPGESSAGGNPQRAPTPQQTPNRTTTMASTLIADAADDIRIA